MSGMDYMDETVEDRLSERVEKLEELCRIMFDPENQPPQFSISDAWEKFKEINNAQR